MNRMNNKRTDNLKIVVVVLVVITICFPLLPGFRSKARADGKGTAFLGGMVAGHIVGGAIRRSRIRTAAAVEAARLAYPTWRDTPASERASALHHVASQIRDHHNELVHLLTEEEGKPIPENDEELWWTEETFDYYAEIGRHDRGKVIPPGAEGQFNFVIKEPWGVVASAQSGLTI